MMKCMGAEAYARALESQPSDLGIGEKVDDLVVFDPELYVDGLFE